MLKVASQKFFRLYADSADYVAQRENPRHQQNPRTIHSDAKIQLMIKITEESFNQLPTYSQLSIAFQVNTILAPALADSGLGGIRLQEHPVATPYVKDYDAIDGGHIVYLGETFDLTNWGMLLAWENGRLLGGVILAYNTAGVNMLEGRNELVVLWDIRVSLEARRKGVGKKLLAASERWARQRQCRQMKIETQNINVAACRFYASQGYELGAINRFAYPDLPHEVQLFWYKEL